MGLNHPVMDQGQLVGTYADLPLETYCLLLLCSVAASIGQE